ncbi:MAG: hypothetical protein WBR56_11295 [Sedimenticolaceae bacterium]
MEYGVFKALLGLLFFGAVFAFGIWQLVDLKRDTRPKKQDRDHADRTDADTGP